MSWKTFEEECTSYLNRKYGIKFEQQGESDSTVSDILYCGEKKSGSSSLNSSNKSDFEYAMGIAGIDFSFSGLDIISDRNLDGVKVNGKKYDYLLRENGSTYKVRKLSNTRNANVIFSIELMDYDVEEQKKDVIQFENTISK